MPFKDACDWKKMEKTGDLNASKKMADSSKVFFYEKRLL
jgi:hypothetical protein